MSIEKQLVRHLLETTFDDLPAEAVNSARREVLWALGTCVAGAGASGSNEVITFVRQIGGREESTVMGFGDRVPATMAGFANGVFAKALEYEDKLWLDRGHAYAIGTAVVPAAFAVAEHAGGVGGKELLLAVALATDIQGRMVKAATGSVATGWNSTYVYASLGAAMAAGRLLDLTEDQFLNAMGLAYSQTTGNYQGHQEGVLGVRMQMGFGVRNGITAAQLAKLGVTGANQFLTGKFGLYPLFYRSDIKVNLDVLTADLGSSFSGTELGFKAYPCCAVIHPVLDAVLDLGADLPAPERVESVKVYGTPRMKIAAEPQDLRKHPKSDVDCQFSIPWAVACALVDRKISLSHFTHQALKNRRYAELAPRVDTDMAHGREGVFVEIHLKNGQLVRSKTVHVPKGHWENPLTTEEIVDKYRDCVRHGPKSLSNEQVEEAKDLVLRLEEVPDATSVIRLLA